MAGGGGTYVGMNEAGLTAASAVLVLRVSDAIVVDAM